MKIKLIVRGACILLGGVKGHTENIEIISIVDRFLEHARILVFHNGGQERYYMSSADWMERNLTHRIETTYPVYDPDLQKEIRELLDLQLNDNVKARTIDRYNTNEYRRSASDIPVRAQIETYFYYKRKLENTAAGALPSASPAADH